MECQHEDRNPPMESFCTDEGFGSVGQGSNLRRRFRLLVPIQEYRLVRSRLKRKPEGGGVTFL